MNNTLTYTGKVLAGLLFFVGGFLYIASYFSGLYFIGGGVAILGGLTIADQGISVFLKKLIYLGKKAVTPCIGVLIALLLGAVLMLLTGYNPIVSYKALLYGGFIANWHISILNAVPLMFTGLSIAFAFQAGLFNIGAEGQYYIGAMAATWLGLRLDLNPLFIIPLIFIIAGFAGAAYNAIPALLKVKTGASEVVTTMMFAYIATTLSSLFVKANGGDPATSTHAYITDTIFTSAWLPRFKAILPNANYRLHIGILIAIGTAFLVHIILYKTKVGFEIRAVGSNKEAARTQGISIGKTITIAMMGAGFLASMSGVTQVLGLDHKMFENLNAGYGWNGIAVALLAGNSPIGVIFTALLWGVLDAGGQYMARTVQTSNAIVEIIKGTILFLILAKYLVQSIFLRRAKKQGRSL